MATLPVAGDADHPFVAPLASRNDAHGTLRIWASPTTLVVELDADRAMVAAQLHVAARAADVPQTKNGNPIPGAFRWKDAPGASSWRIEIARSELPDGMLVVAAHADLADGTGTWAGTVPFSGPNWARYAAITINQPPRAAFTTSISALTLSVDASASTDPEGSPLTFGWRFGDGTAATLATPVATHEYATGGSYTVTLVVSDAHGGTAEQTATVLANRPPVAAITRTPGADPLVVGFSAAGSSDPDGDVLTYAWTFGDGTTAGNEATVEHRYAASGSFTATVTVTDAHGATAQAPVSFTLNRAPVASFTTAGGTTPLSIVLDASGSSDPDGDALTYAWDFGDGSSGVGVTASRSYAAPGTYTVTLTVTDPSGASNQANRAVTLNPPRPDLRFTSCTVSPAAPTNADQVMFTLTLRNDGASDAVFPAGYFGYDMTNGGSYSPQSNLSGTTLAAGASRQVSISWPPYWHTPGSYTPTVRADPSGRIAESDETNNAISCPVTIVQGPQPDLVITNVEVTTNPIVYGSDFRFKVTVKNQGTAAASISYPGRIAESNQAYYIYAGSPWTLAAGASQTFEVQPNWGYIAVGTHDWTWRLDPDSRVIET
ncbi:MAG TPA: PKD domain-containing protein, partial [Gemmatimonadaceae bacterium]